MRVGNQVILFFHLGRLNRRAHSSIKNAPTRTPQTQPTFLCTTASLYFKVSHMNTDMTPLENYFDSEGIEGEHGIKM